jgi:hypothetical protein
VAQLILPKLMQNLYRGKCSPKIGLLLSFSWNYPNSDPFGENSPYLVTLVGSKIVKQMSAAIISLSKAEVSMYTRRKVKESTRFVAGNEDKKMYQPSYVWLPGTNVMVLQTFSQKIDSFDSNFSDCWS